ncbi:MAG: amino acid permease [Candidatus Xenobia bacterium]
MRGLFKTKRLDEILAHLEDESTHLKRSLGAVHITLLGVGAIIGAGIFAIVGTAAAGDNQRPGAGPSLMLSFVITAAVCAFTAFCYAEFASMVPISGSAYTYSYATLGELVAWIIGWDLIIEYAVGNVTVAISWANYFRSLMHSFGINIPGWLSIDYATAASRPGPVPFLNNAEAFGGPHIFGHTVVFNLLAFLIVAVITVVLVWGIQESATFNAVMVTIKIIVLIFFCGMALHAMPVSQMAANWIPFQPNGWSGTLAGAAIVFFAYIGFDAVSTVAEETRNPTRDLPIGILGSLIICTIIYVVVAAVFTGILPYNVLKHASPDEQAEPLSLALKYLMPGSPWAAAIVSFGAVIANTAVLLVFQLGQPRIFFSMARDGLLPPVFAKVHPRFKTPVVTTILTGVVVGCIGMVSSIDEMADLTNIGTLFAFVLVCIGISIMRVRDPDRARPFKVPFGPFVMPVLGTLSCLFLMWYLPPTSWWRFISWLCLGLSVYTVYGYRHSEIGRNEERPTHLTVPHAVASFGFLSLAVGLWTLPHDLNPLRLIGQLSARGPEFVPLLLVVVGLACVGIGLTRGSPE